MSFLDAFTVFPVWNSFIAFVTDFFNQFSSHLPVLYFVFSIWGLIVLIRLVIEVIG